MLNFSVDYLSLAVNALHDILPDLKIAEVIPAYDGIVFQSVEGQSYKYLYAEDMIACVGNWRSGGI